MKLWKVYHSKNNDEWVEARGKDFTFALEVLNDEPRIKGWETLRLVGVDGTRSPLQFDSPWFTGRSLVLTERAKECLEDLFSDCVELLPAELDGEPLWLAHVMGVEGCVDYESSSFDVRSTGRIRGFFEYQFIEEAVRDLNLFGIPDERVYNPFVSDAFVSRVEECGLRGFAFKLVWDSELPPGSIVFETICV